MCPQALVKPPGPPTARRHLEPGAPGALAGGRRRLRPAYVLLETVIATGLLIVGLAVIGAQVQEADTTIRSMELRVRALALAERQLALLDLGLVELDSVDEIEEGDFGSRYPDWGWRITTVKTAVDDLYRRTLEILYLPREGEYEPDAFDFDNARRITTSHAFHAAPQSVDFAEDFGLGDEEVEALSKRLTEIPIPGLDVRSFDPAILAKVDIEELIGLMPVLMDAFGFEIGDVAATLPPDLLEQIKGSGLFGEETGEGGDSAGGPAEEGADR